jgi:hypothetical protein
MNEIPIPWKKDIQGCPPRQKGRKRSGTQYRGNQETAGLSRQACFHSFLPALHAIHRENNGRKEPHHALAGTGYRKSSQSQIIDYCNPS